MSETRFEYYSPNRILFGRNSSQQAGEIGCALGKRPLLVTGSDPDRYPELLDSLGDLPAGRFTVSGEPTLELVRQGVAVATGLECDSAIAVGGGSVLDAAKAISGLLTNPGDPLDYLEVIGRGQPLANRAVPLLALPTTAGTGSEVTRNAVLAAPEQRVKVSLRNARLLPSCAIVDPVLTLTCPPTVTARSGLDALSQLVEPYVTLRRQPLTDGLCRDGMKRIRNSLERAFHSGGDLEAREEMSLAGLFGGIALGNAGLGAVHGLAGPLGGLIEAPHGALCGCLLPEVCRTNISILEESHSSDDLLARYDEIARILTGEEGAGRWDGVVWLEEIRTELDIPSLSRLGLAREMFDSVIDGALRASSMKGNPIKLERRQLAAILDRAFR